MILKLINLELLHAAGNIVTFILKLKLSPRSQRIMKASFLSLSHSCHVKVLQKKKLQIPIQFIVID
jgi:hypothetical protein